MLFPKRKPLYISPETLVSLQPLDVDKPIPVLVRPLVDGVDLVDWALANSSLIREQLTEHAALLFRGFLPLDLSSFERFARSTSTGGELMDYSYSSTPRRRLVGKIYTSTEYPSEHTIPLHNEMSYTNRWPNRIWFQCRKVAEQRGGTPIADSARVAERLSPQIVDTFERLGVLYTRHFYANIDRSLEEVFGTNDVARIKRQCESQDIDCTLLANGHIRTRQRCPALTIHPVHGVPLWFNQAHLFHSSALPPALTESLLREYGEDGLPRSASYGDGSPIDVSALAAIRHAYAEEAVMVKWMAGDVLMLDNMRIAHGRDAYSGERQVAVVMADEIVRERTRRV